MKYPIVILSRYLRIEAITGLAGAILGTMQICKPAFSWRPPVTFGVAFELTELESRRVQHPSNWSVGGGPVPGLVPPRAARSVRKAIAAMNTAAANLVSNISPAGGSDALCGKTMTAVPCRKISPETRNSSAGMRTTAKKNLELEVAAVLENLVLLDRTWETAVSSCQVCIRCKPRRP